MRQRVLHIINDIESKNGGAQSLLRTLHMGLLDQQFNSRVLSLTNVKQKLDRAEGLNNQKVYSFNAFILLAKRLRSEPQDVVLHLHLFPTVLYVALIKKIYRLRNTIVFTEHSTSNRRRGSVWGKALDRFIYSSIDKVIAISEGTGSELIEWMPKLRSRVQVIYNGISIKRHLERNYSMNKSLRLLSVGRLTTAKNYENTILAFTQLQDFSVSLDIAGDGELKDNLHQIILDEELSQKVNLLGHRTDLDELYTHYDAFILASAWEGFGLSVAEAMNVGLPVILSDIPGLKEVGGDAAIYVNPNSPRDIADKIVTLLATPGLRRVMGEKAFERSQSFDIKQTVIKHLEFYNSLV